jgi:hypothetical protein
MSIAIGNAFKRKNIQVDYTILSNSPFAFLARDFKHLEIPLEDVNRLTPEHYGQSILYEQLTALQPDALIVDLFWLPLYHLLPGLKCKKIFLTHQVNDDFFHIDTPEIKMQFNAHDYDLLLAVEPFKSCLQMQTINPLIVRNRDEILTREAACQKLGLDPSRESYLLYYNGHPDDFTKVKKIYSYLEEEGHQIFYTTNYKGGLFPVVDYFNAFDVLICGAGYNSFWEARFFEKEAIFVPAQTVFESQQRRLAECSDYTFTENGADEFVDKILQL